MSIGAWWRSLPTWGKIAAGGGAGLAVLVLLERVAAAKTEAIVNDIIAAWPSTWRQPTSEMLVAASHAASRWDVPVEIVLATMQHESGFKQRAWRGEPANWEKWRSRTIPGTGVTWGEVYTVDDWGSVGLMQLMPHWYIGTESVGQYPAGTATRGGPLEAVEANVDVAVHGLRQFYDETGDWGAAVQKYNPNSAGYADRTLAYAAELGYGGETETETA